MRYGTRGRKLRIVSHWYPNLWVLGQPIFGQVKIGSQILDGFDRPKIIGIAKKIVDLEERKIGSFGTKPHGFLREMATLEKCKQTF